MTCAKFTADIPPERAIEFNSAEEMEEAFQQSGVYLAIRSLGNGKFRSALTTQITEQADLFSDRYGTAQSIHCEPPADTLTVNASHIRVARFAQDYIEEHFCEAVHIEDLCRVTGVGVRTLQRCFREYFDITVSSYLRAVRLDSARRELLAAHRSDTSVTRIAMHNGCTHLGRFSVEFRERFGETPRETLRIQAGQK